MATPTFTPALSFASHPMTALASGQPSQPSQAERQQQWVYQVGLQVDTTPFAGWAENRYEQANHYRDAVSLAIEPYLQALRASKFKVLKRKPVRDGIISKSAGAGHHTRDEEFEPLDPDHPLCKIVARPNGDRGKWSMAREMAYLTLQYFLTGDAPAWTPVNGAGKPVQFYSLVSATTTLQIAPGADARYPHGAWR